MEGEVDFAGLVDRHYGALYRFALSLTRTEPDACDLVQEAFHTWAEKGCQLQDPTKAKSWLFTTLHRSFLKRQQRVVRFPEVELSAAELDLPTLPPALVERLDGRLAMELLGRVDDPFRAPLALFYLEDCSYLEIAEILDIPLGTVKSRIARGLAQLRELLLRGPGVDRLTEEKLP
jgi:RNA polymerase sigma-70 factor, ECF subfamily